MGRRRKTQPGHKKLEQSPPESPNSQISGHQIEGMEVKVHVIEPIYDPSDSEDNAPSASPIGPSDKLQTKAESHEHQYYRQSTRSRSRRRGASVTVKKEVTEHPEKKRTMSLRGKSKKNIQNIGEIPAGVKKKRRASARTKKMKKGDTCQYKVHQRCPYCFQVSIQKRLMMDFQEKTRLERHLEIYHSGKSPVRCAICDGCYVNNGTLRRHHFKAHGIYTDDTRDHTCSECGYTTIYPNNFKRHLLRHAEKSVFCKICDIELVTEEQLRNHMENTHQRKGKKPTSGYNKHVRYTGYTCEICHVTLESLLSMEEHMDTHYEPNNGSDRIQLV